MSRKTIISILILILCGLFIFGCAGNRVSRPPALAECVIPGGSIGATVTGTGVDPATRQSTEIRTQARFDNPSKNMVTWSVGGAPTSAADPISGTSGTGTLTPSAAGPGQDDVNIRYTAAAGTITVQGVIGSSTTPGICTGNGTWTATNNRGEIGRGNWTIP